MNRSCRLGLFSLTAICFFPLATQAQEWTRFRGPDGTGISETAFPAQFSDKDFAWKIQLPGGGHSSPVVWGDKVFLTCSDDATALRTVVCVSAKDGGIEWKKEYGSHTFKHHGDNSYSSSTPAVDADRVYVCWNTPEEFTLVALNHSGVEVWKTSLGPVDSQHGSGNSPIVVGDMVIMGDEQDGPSFLFGLDRATGKVKWKTPRKAAKYAYSTPLVFHPKSGADQLVFTSQAEGMTGVDPATGKVVWELPTLFDSRTVASPATGAGLIFGTCGEGPGGHVLVAVRPGNGTAEVVWKTKTEAPYVPTPLVKGDRLYYWNDRGKVTCAHAETGKIIWQESASAPGSAPGAYFSSPICAGSMLFDITKKGDVVALAEGEKFAFLGKTSLNEKCHATPAISGGRMFIRTYTHLYCIKGTGGQASIGE